MKLYFLGANRQVTGSRYCVEAAGKRVMVDCGMFQEREFLDRNWQSSPLPAAKIDALLLTHVHIDHSGLIPRLVREGFRGPIYATRPTIALADIVLRDSAKIQEEDAEYKKKRHQKEHRKGKHPEIPLYTLQDAEAALDLFQPIAYEKPLQISENITARFHDAGHILGSAMIDLQIEEAGKKHCLLFSGDIGQWEKPLIRDPTLFERADYVVMESTYGDRDHQEAGDIDQQLADIVNLAAQQKGAVVIPTFAVERAQELLYHLSDLLYDRRIPQMPVFLDSPMAVNVTEVFRKFHDYFDQETWQRISTGDRPLAFPGLSLARSTQESKAINDCKGPCIIMATSGMCTAGRIKHHLKQRLTSEQNIVLFVGYQGKGTLGRQILEGSNDVRIHNRHVKVRAKVAQIYGFSGHADRGGLLKWIGNLKSAPKWVFLTHGDEEAAASLALEIRRRHDWPVAIPAYGETVELE